MTANQEKIIQLLRKHRRITAAALAQELKVSDRSIRNYIAQICTEYPDAVHSDRHGYHLNKPELFSAGYEYQDIPQSMEERTVFLLNLLISTDENVYHVQRVQCANKEPICIMETYLIRSLFPKKSMSLLLPCAMI